MENQNYKSKLNILDETEPYKILGIKENASTDEIIKIYKELAKEFHPDRHSNKAPKEKKEIELIFSKITTAFNLLKDADSRKKYDDEKKIRLEREEMLKAIQNPQGAENINLFQTQPGSINLNSLFSDNKVGTQEVKNKKADALFNSGITKFKKGLLDDAIADLQSAIGLNGQIGKYHSNLGLFMKEKGWNGYAMAEFKIALNFDPNDKLALEHYKKSDMKNASESGKDKSDYSILNRVKNLFRKS